MQPDSQSKMEKLNQPITTKNGLEIKIMHGKHFWVCEPTVSQ